ncbi:fasciclin domain-containing protein [Pontibacter sp. H249]|uniref:fasciclin domain-containing protein n=1 Tax=Pontibacter sp. H249 TaxID=3133420 RepID=UPI0030C2CFEC
MKNHKYNLLLFTLYSVFLAACAGTENTDTGTNTTTAETQIMEDNSGSQAAMNPDTDMSSEDTTRANVSADNTIGRDMNIVALVQQNPNLSTFFELIKQADMVVTLESPAPYTVFAPTNEAFEALPAGTVEALKQTDDKIELRRLIQAHILPNRIASTEMRDNMPMKTAQGDNVIVRKKGQTLTVGNATVVIADVTASNGIVHVIDRVLVPPKK